DCEEPAIVSSSRAARPFTSVFFLSCGCDSTSIVDRLKRPRGMALWGRHSAFRFAAHAKKEVRGNANQHNQDSGNGGCRAEGEQNPQDDTRANDVKSGDERETEGG